MVSKSTPHREFDGRAAERAIHRMVRAGRPPWLHEEVARRMAERLSWIRRTPSSVLEWSAWLGGGDPLLAATYPQAARWWYEPTPAATAAARAATVSPWWSVKRWRSGPQVIDDPTSLPAAPGLLWSNMALHGVNDPPALLRRWQRALAVDGFLMFSTLGPGTLRALQQIYDEQGWGPAAAPFVDMHDLGDMLVEAGFADPVMDQELLVLTWPDADAALVELRGLGANAAPGRHPGCRTPRWRQALADALHAQRDASGRISLTFELVYGHAFNAPPKVRMASVTAVSVDDMRRMIKPR